MKTIGILILALVLNLNLVFSQDSLRVYKAGQITIQQAVDDIDSINLKIKQLFQRITTIVYTFSERAKRSTKLRLLKLTV